MAKRNMVYLKKIRYKYIILVLMYMINNENTYDQELWFLDNWVSPNHKT